MSVHKKTESQVCKKKKKKNEKIETASERKTYLKSREEADSGAEAERWSKPILSL